VQPQATAESISSSTTRLRAVTFREFAELSRRRNLSAQALADRFRGRIESPLEFFTRVLSTRSPDSVIPYRSVLEFYAVTLEAEPAPAKPLCACGCGEPVFDRKKWAKPGCRKKAQRKDIRNRRIWVRQLSDFVDSKVGQNRRMAVLPLTGPENANLGR
jgi:hypothetical protein